MDVDKELEEKLRFLEANKGAAEIGVLERTYAILTVLDGKASALMTVNAFLAAFPALSIEHYRTAKDTWGLWLSLGLIGALVISALLCFFVVRIQWGWLAHVDHKTDKKHFDREIKELTGAIVTRTGRYRWAWWTTLGCLLGMIVLALHYAMH